MPSDIPQVARRPQWNEDRCLVVALPANTTCHQDVHFVPIVWQSRGAAATRPAIVRAEPQLLPFFPRGRLMGLLCADRAVRTVAGELYVWGGHITPESYLRRWREALRAPVSIAALAERHHLCLRVVMSAVLDRVHGTRYPGADSPFQSFEDFEAIYGRRFVHATAETGITRFGLSLDLREPEAPRHAFYASSLLSSREEAQARIHVSLASVDWHLCRETVIEGQATLFEEAAQ